MQTIRFATIPPIFVRSGEAASGRFEDLLAPQVETWAGGIVIPSYLNADGRPGVGPETTLQVQGVATAPLKS